MFEKDAIDRANRKYPIPRVYDELDVARNRKYEEGFKDGAEFGYNKANEWHKQDIVDIYDSIATDWSAKHYLCIMKDKRIVAAEGNCDEGCNGEVSVNLFFEHDDEKYYIDDIVWWKEIELPKN